MTATVTEKQIQEAIKKWCKSWLEPQAKTRCDSCKSTYEPLYCETVDGKTLCKGCKEAPL